MKSQQKFWDFPLFFICAAVIALAWTVSVSAQQDDPHSQIDLGAQLYADNCAVCHGMKGEGRIGATLAKNWPSIRPDLLASTTIAAGIAGTAMPAWSQENGGPLTATEIEAVVAYILSWQTGGAQEFTPRPTSTARPVISPVPNVQGDPNQGALLYDQNCAVCHGSEGQGRIGATLAKNWDSIRPDLAIRTTILRGVSGSAMPAWGQENGGPLTEAEIDDIVSFVMSWPAAAQTTLTPITPPEATSPYASWAGVILAIVLFALIVGGIVLFQIRKKE